MSFKLRMPLRSADRDGPVPGTVRCWLGAARRGIRGEDCRMFCSSPCSGAELTVRRTGVDAIALVGAIGVASSKSTLEVRAGVEPMASNAGEALLCSASLKLFLGAVAGMTDPPEEGGGSLATSRGSGHATGAGCA